MTDKAFEIVSTLVMLVFSLSLHEWAHAATAVYAGDDTPKDQGRLTLNPLAHIDPIGTLVLPLAGLLSGGGALGWAKPVQMLPRRFRHERWLALTAVAGPAMNIAIALVATLVCKIIVLAVGIESAVQPTEIAGATVLIMFRLIQMNIFLALFNLIPVPPLDGHYLIEYYVIRHNRTLVVWWEKLREYSFIIFLIIIVSPFTGQLLSLVGRPILKGLARFTFGFPG